MEERRERVLTPSAGAAAYRGRRHVGSRWRRTVAQCHGDSGKREQRMTIRRAKNREYILNDTRIKACLRRFDDNVYTRLEFSESGEPQHARTAAICTKKQKRIQTATHLSCVIGKTSKYYVIAYGAFLICKIINRYTSVYIRLKYPRPTSYRPIRCV